MNRSGDELMQEGRRARRQRLASGKHKVKPQKPEVIKEWPRVDQFLLTYRMQIACAIVFVAVVVLVYISISLGYTALV